MAGEWLKMEACTPEKFEVLAITAKMGWDDADLTVGKLFRMWRWFDQQTTDGNALGVTSALLDRIVGVTGFCDAMQSVGWLIVTAEGISLPNFSRHNGNTAKNRAQTAKRVASHKSKGKKPPENDGIDSGNGDGNGEGNDEGNADNVTGALPRKEKKRKDIKEPNGSSPLYPPGLDIKAWTRWVDYRKKIGKSLKPVSIESAQKRLAEHGANQAAVVENSIAAGYQGLFDTNSQAPGRGNRQADIEQRNRDAVEAAMAQEAGQ